MFVTPLVMSDFCVLFKVYCENYETKGAHLCYNVPVRCISDSGAVSSDGPPVPVCRTMFAAVYGITDHCLRTILDGLRNPAQQKPPQVVSSTASATPPATAAAAAANQCREPIDMKREGMRTTNLSAYEITAAREIQTDDHAYAYGWFSVTAELVGDKMPNSDHIHLDPVAKRQFWYEYVVDMRYIVKRPTFLNYNSFCELWREQFGHVKIRKYKSVTGKCSECAAFAELKQHATSAALLKHIKLLRAYHRYSL